MAINGRNANAAGGAPNLELLAEQEVASFLHKTARVLRFWRTAGTGPAYVKLGKTVLPCEPKARRHTVALCKRGRFWHYEFQVNGTRYRGSTKHTTEARARQVEVRKMQEAQESGYSHAP